MNGRLPEDFGTVASDATRRVRWAAGLGLASLILAVISALQLDPFWAQALLILGVLLIALEGVLPTVGFELAAGMMCIVGALASLLHAGEDVTIGRVACVVLPTTGAATTGGIAALLIAGTFFAPRSPAPANFRAAPADVPPGTMGKAWTALRPGGRAEFGGRQVDVQSQDGYIPAGAPVVAVRWNEKTLLVRAADPAASRD